MIRIYLIIAAVLTGAGGLWWINRVLDDRAALQVANAALQRSIEAKDMQIELSTFARTVTEAAYTRLKQRADEYDALRESLLKGGQDAPIPDWFCDYLNGLLGKTCDRNTPAIP